jgi:putative NADH-flavin reductase
MKITIFGATGSLGRQCLEQALSGGHHAMLDDDTWLHKAPIIQY